MLERDNNKEFWVDVSMSTRREEAQGRIENETQKQRFNGWWRQIAPMSEYGQKFRADRSDWPEW